MLEKISNMASNPVPNRANEVCKNCGKKMTDEEIRNQEGKLDGCRNYCSKECCDRHFDRTAFGDSANRNIRLPYPDCPCY